MKLHLAYEEIIPRISLKKKKINTLAASFSELQIQMCAAVKVLGVFVLFCFIIIC